jgi:hypothetical protein
MFFVPGYNPLQKKETQSCQKDSLPFSSKKNP